MGVTLYLTGRWYNALSRATSLVADAEHADTPVSNLHDQRPLNVFTFGSLSGESVVDVDLQLVDNGEFEDAFVSGLPASGWSKTDTAILTRDTDHENGGEAALVASGAANNEDWTEYDVPVRAGERLRVSAALKKVASGGSPARVDVYLRENDQWLQSDGQWSATQTQFAQTTGTIYVSEQIEAVVPEPESSADLTELTLAVRLYCGSGAAVNAYDDVEVIPELNFVSVHGHDLELRDDVELYSDDEPTFAGATLRAALTVRRPSFYSKFTPVIERYWRLSVDNWDDARSLGELVLGRSKQLTREAVHEERKEHPVDYTRHQVRHSTEAGDEYVYNLSEERRVVTLPYDGEDDDMREVLLEVIRRSGHGRETLVIVPDDEARDVVLGRVRNVYQTSRFLEGHVATDVVIEESALPQFGE